MADYTETDRAWAAGFLDGEGCFTLLKNSSKSQHETTRGVNISAIQVKKEPLIRLQKILGGRINGPVKNGNRAKQDAYCWRISNAEEAKKAIEIVFPYLQGKEEDAAIVYSYSLTVGKPGRRNTSSSSKKIRQNLIDRLVILRKMI